MDIACPAMEDMSLTNLPVNLIPNLSEDKQMFFAANGKEQLVKNVLIEHISINKVFVLLLLINVKLGMHPMEIV